MTHQHRDSTGAKVRSRFARRRAEARQAAKHRDERRRVDSLGDREPSYPANQRVTGKADRRRQVLADARRKNPAVRTVGRAKQLERARLRGEG